MNAIIYIALEAVSALLNMLPLRVRLGLVTSLVRIVVFLMPRYRRIALRNLELAFPEESESWRVEVFRCSCKSLAQVFVDLVRLPQLNGEWMEKCVEFPKRERFMEIYSGRKSGMLILGAHLGSFELLSLVTADQVGPFAFVARRFKQGGVDRWWNSRRCRFGHHRIDRKGGLKGILRALKSGIDVGILCDQNVKRNQAVFVDWFGRPAATTKAVGLAAIRTEALAVVLVIRPVGFEKYLVEMEECDFSSIYADSNRSKEDKILAITKIVVENYEKLIRKDPSGWFWMHRRWRTTPSEEIAEDFYRGCIGTK